MSDQAPPDEHAARRVDHPDAPPDQLPYDEEMTEPDEANAPDAAEATQASDMEIGAPDRGEGRP